MGRPVSEQEQARAGRRRQEEDNEDGRQCYKKRKTKEEAGGRVEGKGVGGSGGGVVRTASTVWHCAHRCLKSFAPFATSPMLKLQSRTWKEQIENEKLDI